MTTREHVMTTSTSERDENDDDKSNSDSDNDSKIQALEMFLGGLALGDLSMDAWEKQSDDNDEEPCQEADELGATPLGAVTRGSVVKRDFPLDSIKESLLPVTMTTSRENPNDNDNHQRIMFARAYTCRGYCTRNGRVERPPIRIVHTGDKTRGNIALATRFIPKNQVIFTERAATAVAVGSTPSLVVRACPHCLRSLEPAASLCQGVMVKDRNENSATIATNIPMPHLWPVANFDVASMEPVDNDNNNKLLLCDAQRRLFCKECDTYFCSQQCLEAMEREMGVSHCIVMDIQQAVSKLDDAQVQSPLLLATRMFVQFVKHFRDTGQLQGTFIDGLCGEAVDVRPLELGVETRDTHTTDKASSALPRYSLQPVYNLLATKLSFSDVEKEELDLTLFEKISAIAARNAVGFRTKSPFKSYYAALLRHGGEWGSPQHQANMDQLTRALGRTELDRNIDHEIEERVAPAVAGLFPLTARLNHACQPNAEIQSQVFVDCHIDVVATRDIAVSEEITISYLGPVRQSTGSGTARRRRQLRAKYLFDCCCSLCRQST